MKFSLTAATDLENTLRLIGRALPETDDEIDAFMAAVDSGEIEFPAVPEYLSARAIVRSIREGHPAESDSQTRIIDLFGSARGSAGMTSLRMAARNGDGALSEETLKRMEESQGD